MKVDRTAMDKEMGTDHPIDEGRGAKRSLDQSPAGRGRDRGRDRGRRAGTREEVGPKRGKKTGGVRHHEVGEDGKYLCNRQGNSLCAGFQSGQCPLNRSNIRCPKDSRKFHQCDGCLDPTHIGDKCPKKEDGKIPEAPRAIKKQQDRMGW